VLGLAVMARKALICGISGQDGPFLAKLLLEKGYEVFGTSRDAQLSNFGNLKLLGIFDDVTTLSMTLTDFRSVLTCLTEVMPDEIYNLAGQSSVSLSFQQPVETLESISVGTLNLLESMRFLGSDMKLYNAGSSECYGDTHGQPADENTAFRPRSPYAVAKSAAFWQVANYREAYSLKVCSGILFNHESQLRPKRFVTQKIIQQAVDIAKGKAENLKLGNISIVRDWGWAPEYVEAMWLMLQQDVQSDYVIATGESYSLEEFVKYTFDCLDLEWKQYVEFDNNLMRPTDIMVSKGNASKAHQDLGWKAASNMHAVIDEMLEKYLKVCG